jgi:predicted DNA-binding transcriptional regulator YafY
MNRTALSIRMLLLLKSRGKMKKKDIAEALETNPRNIIEFKRELEVAGYAIAYENGPYGGYYLMDRSIFPVAALSEKERIAVKRFDDFSEDYRNFLLYDHLKDAVTKILAASQSDIVSNTFLHVIKKFPMSKDEQDLQDIYLKVHTGIQNRQKLMIRYDSLNSGNKKERIVHPYELFQYSDSWYMIAYEESKKTFICFKLVRITYIDNLNDKFEFDKTFDVTQYIDNYGIKMDGQKMKVKLKLYAPHNRIVSERIIGEGQKMSHYDGYSILEVTMSGDFIIKQFILGMGKSCEVLAPKRLRESIHKELEAQLEVYRIKDEDLT